MQACYSRWMRAAGFVGFCQLGKINAKRRASASNAGYRDVPATLLDDAVGGRQPKPGSFTFLLRSKEGLKDVGQNLRIDPLPIVTDRNHDVLTRHYIEITTGEFLVKYHFGS